MLRIKEFKEEAIKHNHNLPVIVKLNLIAVQRLAILYNWDITGYHQHSYILHLQRDDIKMNVYLTKLTIQTSMKHPKKGKTQLNRRNLKIEEVAKILENPRTHTGKGYYKK